MKLKTIASAAIAIGAAASFSSAFAGIDTTNTAEIFFVAFDANGSYAKDTGITMNTWLGASGLANTSASNFSMNVGSLYANLNAATTQWGLYAVDADGVGDPLDFRMLTTGTKSVKPEFLTANNLQDDVGSMSLAIVNINQLSHAAFSFNDETFAAKGTVAYYNDQVLSNAGTKTLNTIGTSSSMWLAQNASYDSSDPTSMTKLGGVASFNGTTFSYAVTPVPEPETVALMLAGLGAIGFVARRREA